MDLPNDALLKDLVQSELKVLAELNAIERNLLDAKLNTELEELDTHYHVSRDLFWNTRRAAGTALSTLRAHREAVGFLQRTDWEEAHKIAEFQRMGIKIVENERDFGHLLQSYDTLSSNLRSFASSIAPTLSRRQSELSATLRAKERSPQRSNQGIRKTPVVIAVSLFGTAAFFSLGYKGPGILWVIITTTFVVGDVFMGRARRSSRTQVARSVTESERRIQQLEQTPIQINSVADQLLSLSQRVKILGHAYSLVKVDRDAIAPLLGSGRFEAVHSAVSHNQETFDGLERSLRTYSRLGPGASWP